MRLGRRGVAFLGPGVRLISYIVICLHPPYAVMVIFFIFAGFGNGLEDAAWNAWVANMEKANEVLGFLHGFYGLGATLSPLIATTMVTKAKLQWYTFYYILIGAAVIELVAAVAAFWTNTGPAYREANPRSEEETGNRMKEALNNRVTWVCSVFLLVCVGIEVAISGWVVVFMMNIRHAAPFPAGMGETGYWMGLTVGRVVLGFVTGRLGEMTAIIVSFVSIGFSTIKNPRLSGLTNASGILDNCSGNSAHILACPQFLRLCRGCFVHRLLPGTFVSGSHRSLYETTSPASARSRHWLCCS